jgi:glycosyltransferase involved in cell wall biosynthesis
MPSTPDNHPWPRVSFIMPTLNAAALLDNILDSITRQTYPRDRYEIILADALSTDDTRKIAQKYGALVLDDHGKNMEEGKRLALRHATGEYIVFVDADNEITHPDYIELAVRALAANPQALGVEGYYLPSPKMTSFCAYLTHRLHISDPLCWLMSANPRLLARTGDTERWVLPPGTYSYPLGANGFVYRRADLESVQAGEKFQDTHVAMFLMKNGQREWLRISGRGVHHYYVQTLWEFVKKRRRAIVHFLRVQEEMPVNWMKEKPPVPLWLAGVYCVTFAGPLWHTLRGLIRDADPRWLWHLPACLGSVLGSAWGVLTHRRHGGDNKLIARLQTKQNLIKAMEGKITPKSYDLAVCYRIYPGLTGKPAFGFTDKLTLVRANLRSFKAAMGGLKVKMWVILDKCPPPYHELVTSLFAENDLEIIPLQGAGNEGTFLRQVKLLSEQKLADLVYFAEDDYLYLPQALEKAVAFMQRHPEAGFLTLYDHADYHAKYIHRLRGREFDEAGHRWHTVASTCLTFMARQTALAETAEVFATYGRKNSDLGMWLALTKTHVRNPWSCLRSLGDGLFFAASHALAWRHAWRYILFGKRRTLWVPTPSLATHLELSGLAPGVDWNRHFAELQAK